MVTPNGLMRIFWPSDATKGRTPGVLVGFRNSELDVIVVAVLQDVGLHEVENALQVGTLLRSQPHDVQELLKLCHHSSLRALGHMNPQAPPEHFDPLHLAARFEPGTRLPRLHCPANAHMTLQVIVYDRPHPKYMQYLSLSPITLALGDKVEGGKWDPAFEGIEEEEESERRRNADLVKKLELHSVITHSATQKELQLPVLIDQINCSFELNAVLQKNIGVLGRRKKRAQSVNERVVESANAVWDLVYMALGHLWWVWTYPFIAQIVILVLMAQRVTSELVLRALNWRPRSMNSPALKDVSATAQQVDIRLQQLCYWPIQFMTLRKRKENWGSITNSHPEYIRFYNSLWLVANDVIIGVALGSFIFDNAHFVAAQFDMVFHEWSIQGLRRMIVWLSEWPGGLKLNTELADFLGDLFIWVIDYWAGCIGVLRPHLPSFIRLVGLSAFAGATMPISLFSDLTSLLTLHIYSFYVASARIFHWQLTVLLSLFHLFRGKKRNVLRNRIDSCDYDLDQLLLGTILFTLLFFLLPTVLVFYLLFASARVGVIGLKAILEIGLGCLNHFPLFAITLRIKDSRRLPGGICFELQDPKSMQLQTTVTSPASPVSYIFLKSVPLSFGQIFQSYFELGDRIRKHYFSASVLLCLVYGDSVPPIHRRNLYSLQYSMLPAKRMEISQLWLRLAGHESPGLDRPNYNLKLRKGLPNGVGKRGSN
ncbi:Gpi1-domain-containing protein [Paraphaeosphaeria sporulosa]|uniref:Gpi1-domain-containing protein n=1 Tax=Paraphaeosphaeria sporulosa TaxID=1460663 RepID=A0A177BWU1_9PLEO|nr:Gpi1-domain-containing protein [Paraphaeosphaeria sporulosa]OAF99774.1 Gpi1-domain-containing protein [Paraphaeosphaeria sporulosa]